MRRQMRLRLTTRPLELSFVRCWMRLGRSERSRVLADLGQPFRRQWYLVDGQGVRRLRDDE
jgi:hypothetical protein